MEALGIALRRTPLGQLPAARHGIPAAEAGLVLLPYEQTLLTHHAATEVEPDYLIPVGTRRPPARLALRIHGAGAPQALLERHAFGPIHPRFKRRPGSAQDTRLHQLLQPGPYVATDATIRPSRDYLSVTTYDETVLPLADLLVITDDSALAFGWLSSKAFWIWQQMVAQAEPRATTHRAYTTFPAPKLTAKQRQALEVAVDTVLRYEHLTEDLDQLVADLGLSPRYPLPRAKAGIRPPHTPAHEILSAAQARRVAELAHREIETFGYTWPGPDPI